MAWLITQLALLESASALPHEQKLEMAASLQLAIKAEIDDFCGNHPQRWPWPWPGPSPWALEIAAGLTLFAHTLQPGSLQDRVLETSRVILQRANAREKFSEGTLSLAQERSS